MKPFILDNERVLDSSNDLLKTRVYADNLVQIIENTPKNKVFTIGVFGGWGTGKSSIINTARSIIEGKNKNVRFVVYDAWKYANDSFRRMFLLNLQEELKLEQTSEMKRFYQSETVEQEPKMVLSANKVLLIAVSLFILVVVLWFTPLRIDWKVGIISIGTFFSLIVALISGFFYELKLTINKPALFAPEQFEDCFNQMMSKCLKHHSIVGKVFRQTATYLETGKCSVIGLDKLVIVIDNIDRCPNDMAYQLLTDIKTFLSNAESNLVFVIPVDDEALKKHLFRRWNRGSEEEINKEKEEFLRKFFNVTLRIKPHQEAELHHFAHELDKENHLGFSNDTLSIIAKEFADNPRRIIQLLNNLSGEIALYEGDFVNKYEPAICAALILREEYPTFYKSATKDLEVLVNPQSLEDKEITGDIKNKESLKGFIKVTEYIFKQTPLKAKRQIFTNTSSIFSDLPADIRKSVQSFDADKVITFARETAALQSNLVDYVLDCLKTEVKYKATSQITQWADFICRLFKASVFDDSRFGEIDEQLSPFYKDIIPVTSNPENLCQMGSSMSAAGIKALRNSIVAFMKREDAFSQTNFEGFFDNYLVSFTEEDDCKEVSTIVEDYYVEHPINQDIPYTDIQIKHLFGDPFLAKQIDHLAAMDDESKLNDIIWCLKKNKDLTEDSFTSLLGKCSALFGNTRGKTYKQYLDFLQQIHPIWGVIATGTLSDVNGVYDLIISERGIPHPHPSYRNHLQNDSHISILDEVDSAESADSIIAFCYEIMRISGGRTNVSDSINKLYSKNKHAVIDGALRIHEQGVSIAPIANTLVQTTDYQSANDLAIIEIVLSRKNDGSMMLADDVIKTKVRSLTDNSSISGVATLLKKLANDEQVLSIITEYVITLDSQSVNALPSWIAKYAVDTFNKDNAETFKDNPEFLILVLKHGNAMRKKEVVRLMKSKIVKEEDLDNVVLVLNNLETEDQSVLRPLISELDSIKDSETIDETTKKEVAALSAKLSSSLKQTTLVGKFLEKKRNPISRKSNS